MSTDLSLIERWTLARYKSRHQIPSFVYRRAEHQIQDRFRARMQVFDPNTTRVYVECKDTDYECWITVVQTAAALIDSESITRQTLARGTIRSIASHYVFFCFSSYVGVEIARQVRPVVQFARIEHCFFP